MEKLYLSKVLEIAKAQVGYIEKETNAQLDSKTANAGDENFNKYARDFDKKYKGFYYGTKNGYAAWCDIFVDWLIVEASDVERALKALGQPTKSYGAGCTWSIKYFKSIGKLTTENPKAGYQIFFKDKKGEPCHTGLIIKVDNNYIYTIEGNTSSASGVVANGGCVAEKKYKKNYSRIHSFGIIDYDEEPVKVEKPQVNVNSKFDQNVYEWQKAAIADGYSFPEYGADGEWGKECESVAEKAVCRKPLIKGMYKNKNLTKWVQKKVGLKGSDVDGKYWNKTRDAVKAYQQKKGIDVDGEAGIQTYKTILNK